MRADDHGKAANSEISGQNNLTRATAYFLYSLKQGVSRSEIIDLLGLPTYTDQDSLEYSYEIGSNPGLHVDPYFYTGRI